MASKNGGGERLVSLIRDIEARAVRRGRSAGTALKSTLLKDLDMDLTTSPEELESIASKIEEISNVVRRWRGTVGGDFLLDEYVGGMPGPQKAIDAVPGWNMMLPGGAGVTAGTGQFYHDSRVLWALEQCGSIEGKAVLELGPLEASHTWMLEQRNPGLIHAIEANRLAFFRCLIVKEILPLKIAKFFLGDFRVWLEENPQRYDFIVACGVLYHMVEPVKLLESIALRSDSFYLWTHYTSESAMPADDRRRGPFTGETSVVSAHGVDVRYSQRSYLDSWTRKAFCGGMHNLHNWVEREDILALISALGFRDIRIAHDMPDHPNGPCFSVFARR